MEKQKPQASSRATLEKQPLLCPWFAAQPYSSNLLTRNSIPIKNGSPFMNPTLNNHWSNQNVAMDTSNEKAEQLPMQHSASQFFYFLRLMELFPDTHPATLHTVLTLCKNNFFCAVDKLLYAKRCKAMYSKRQSMFQKLSRNRNHPYHNSPKYSGGNNGQGNAAQKFADDHKSTDILQQSETEHANGDNDIKEEKISFEINALNSKDEDEMSSPNDMQQQLKIPMKPLSPSPTVEVPEDLSSATSKVEIVSQQ